MNATKATVANAAVISSAMTANANKISDLPTHANTANKRLRCSSDGEVELFYSGSQKLETPDKNFPLVL